LTRLSIILAAIGAFIVWVLRMDRKGQKADDLQEDVDAHDRISKAPTGADLSDDDRMRRLQQLGQQWDRD